MIIAILLLLLGSTSTPVGQTNSDIGAPGAVSGERPVAEVKAAEAAHALRDETLHWAEQNRAKPVTAASPP